MTSNQTKNLDLFDKVFFLKVDQKELLIRRNWRSKSTKIDDDHDFYWHQRFEDENIKNWAILIDAWVDREQIIEDIFKYIPN